MYSQCAADFVATEYISQPGENWAGTEYVKTLICLAYLPRGWTDISM